VNGWQFDAIVATRKGVVLIRNYGGAPRNERTEREVNPLGPFQGIGDSVSGLLLNSGRRSIVRRRNLRASNHGQ
jgi:hypothetical protein